MEEAFPVILVPAARSRAVSEIGETVISFSQDKRN
jgi:hypothetical protein